MAKSNTKGKSVKSKAKKRSSFRLKRSARWTIAGVLLVTAIIIALIPVQSDGVSAIVAYTVPSTIDDVVNDHGYVEGTSVTGVGTPEYAFPVDDDTLRMNAYADDGTSIGVYHYATIDMTSMDTPTKPVLTYELTKSNSGGPYDCIEKYLGVPGSGSSPKEPEMIMKLGSSVIVTDESAIPASVTCYFSGPKLKKEDKQSGEIIEYRESPQTGTMPIDGVEKSFQYIILDERVHTYTYTPDNPDTPADEEDFVETVGDYGNTRYVLKSNTTNGTDTVSRNVYSIADNAFKGMSNIKQMEIPSTVKLIGNSSFEGCINLESVILSTNCCSIGDKAFANASKLNNIDLSYATILSKIGDGAFANTGISSITFPSGPACEVGSGAFFRCSNLSEVDFSNTGADITLGCYAFSGCPIENISLDNVTTIISHDKDGNKVTTPTQSTNYDPANAKCGIFTKQEDQNTVLKTVTFPSYNGVLPYGTFAGNDNLQYVRFDKPNATAFNYGKQSSTDPEHWEADEFFYEPDNFFIFGDTPSNSGPAAYLYASKNGITYGYIKDGVLTYELTKNGYKYTFSVLNDNECRITNIEKSQIVEPEPEMVIPGKIAQYNVKEIASEAVDVEALEYPKELMIPDTLQTISDRAFVNMPNLEKVSWYDADGTYSSPAITIGNEAFAGDNKITEFNFRDDNHASEYVNDPNIVSVGTDAFKTLTTGSKVTMKGQMGTGYAPFDYAVNPNNRFNTTSSTAYAVYESGNPENLVCQYDPSVTNADGSTGGVVLLSYPTKETDISRDDESAKKISELTGDISVVEEQILYSLHNIVVPPGVTTLDDEKTKADCTGNKLFRDLEDTSTITLYDIDSVPDEAFASKKHDGSGTQLNNIIPSSLESVSFLKDVVDLGQTPFANSKNITSVGFYGEGDASSASSSDPYYWCSNGIIYSYEGNGADGKEIITIEECLPSRGASNGNTTVDPENDPDLPRVSNLATSAFQNCDCIKSVDFSSSENLREISKDCFYDADNLNEVILPDNCDSILETAFAVESGNNTAPENYIDVYVPDVEVYINANAFQNDKNATLHSYNDSAAEKFAKDHGNVDFKPLTDRITVKYLDYDGTVLATFTMDAGDYPDEPATEPTRTGFTFTGWSPKVGKVYTDTTYVAQYSDDSTSSSSSSSSSSSKTSSSSGSNSSSNKSSSSSSSSTNKSSSSSSTGSNNSSSTSRYAVVSGAPAPVGTVGAQGTTSNGSAGKASNSPNGVATGNTNVVSTTPGISNNGKMSATVNGSSDNYVIKLTETAEADEAAIQALTGAFGSLDNIRYMPFDISLYDSTGTQKITPVPEGVTVSVTMPIPDDLAVYGGNNKVASTKGGTLEVIQPRFTVIDGVPCMNFTVSHLSPYVIYVDTANLTANGTLDSTPKTGDPIHPKWFLVIGLCAISIFLFLKKDKERVRTAA